MRPDRKTLIWAAIWLCGSALVLAEIGFWATSQPMLEDVRRYEHWSHALTGEGSFPVVDGWQYPPGAGLLMLLPRLLPLAYGEAFVGLMLLVDLVGLGLLIRLARRTGKEAGVWVWLLGIPLLGTIAPLRFDLAPTVVAIAALLLVHRRPGWFGALVGLGAAIKVWPLLLLFGEWDRSRLLKSAVAAALAAALVLAISAIGYDNATSFVSHGGARGLQEEAVAAIPWQLGQIVGDPYPRAIRFGAWEIASPTADGVAALLRWLTLAALAAAAAWWWLRARAIRAGNRQLAGAAVSRDFVFAVVLGIVVTSPVLSPQYLVWLLGLAAVVLSSESTRLRRPAWFVVGAAALSTATFGSPELILLRDLALLAATIDAALAMVGALGRPGRSARRRRLSSPTHDRESA